MGKESLCPGCKQKFLNGRPYSMHIKSCREIDSAVDEALKKHKSLVAKKSEEKKAAAVVAAQMELEAQTIPADQMDVDKDLEVKIPDLFLFLTLSYIFTG
jgi:hypothetical protein